jgi:hypothetical protein
MAQGVSDEDARKSQRCHMELYYGEKRISGKDALPLREIYLKTCAQQQGHC